MPNKIEYGINLNPQHPIGPTEPGQPDHPVRECVEPCPGDRHRLGRARAARGVQDAGHAAVGSGRHSTSVDGEVPPRC